MEEQQYGLDAATYDLNRSPLKRCDGGPFDQSPCDTIADCPSGGACSSTLVGPEDSDEFGSAFDCATRINQAGANGVLDPPAPVPGACPSPPPQFYRAEIAIGFPLISIDGKRLEGGNLELRTGANPALVTP